MFVASNIDFQDRYKLTNLVNGVDGGDSVAMRQLNPLLQDIANLTTALGDKIGDSEFNALFNAARNNANLFDGTQVSAAIAAALAALPEAESRLASVAVRTVFEGTLANASLAQFPDVSPSDSGEFDDASTSGILLVSPIAGESGLYQLQPNGNLSPLNSSLFAANLSYYTRFYVISSGNQTGREFAIADIDESVESLSIVEVPYVDEYVGLGPISISNVNKTATLNFEAADFVLTDGDKLALHPAIKQAIALIPGLQTAIDTINGALSTINDRLSGLEGAIEQQATALANHVQATAQNISSLASQIQGAIQRIVSLENGTAKKTDFLRGFSLTFRNGVPDAAMLQSGNSVPVPTGFVTVLGIDGDFAVVKIQHDRGQYCYPAYWEANLQGQPTRQCLNPEIVGLMLDAIVVRIENYKNVWLDFPAAIAPTAFS